MTDSPAPPVAMGPGSPDAPPTGRQSASLGLEHPVLLAVRPLAALGVVALITGRAIGPALRGVSMGTDTLVGVVELTGGVSSQVFAFTAMMTAIMAILAVSRSRLPMGLRLTALALGGFAVLPTVWALQQPVPELSALLVAGSASLLALVALSSTLRVPFTRAPGLVAGFIALGGVARLLPIGAAIASPGARLLASVFPVLGTAALLCDAAGIAVALVWIASRSRKLASPGALVALVVAAFITRQALAGQNLDAHGVDLLCWRAAVRMLGTPDASLPLSVRLFVSVLAPMVALVALTERNVALYPLSASVALALAARGAVEMPPCALMLVVSCLTCALMASDRKALWSAMVSEASRGALSGGMGAKPPSQARS